MSEKTTVIDNQMNALAELAKYEVNGNEEHLESANKYAYLAGMVGDEKTPLLTDPLLSKWYEEGLNDRYTDHAIGREEGAARPWAEDWAQDTIKAEVGKTYVGKIVDAGGPSSVYQAVVQDGKTIHVQHDRHDLSSTQSGLINNGQEVSITYPKAGLGLVTERVGQIESINAREITNNPENPRVAAQKLTYQSLLEQVESASSNLGQDPEVKRTQGEESRRSEALKTATGKKTHSR